jgi:hypothetical protein
MTSALDITRSVNPPRAAFLDFPLGHTTGKPDDPQLQSAIVAGALEAFASLREPGSIKRLPFRWADDDQWKRTALAGGDDRQPRHDTPQYQSDEDRRKAEGESPCAVC